MPPLGEVPFNPPLTITTNYGGTLKRSYTHHDEKVGAVKVIYETHDGTKFTGRHFIADVTAAGTTITKPDGSQVVKANPKIDAAAVQALVDWTKLDAFVAAQMV